MNERPLVFLVEDLSLKNFLNAYVPRVFPDLYFICVHFEGKSDLEKGIAPKLKGWKNADFVVLRDNDGADCRVIKKRLVQKCMEGGRPDVKIRIICQELEAWYLGAESVISIVFPDSQVVRKLSRVHFTQPDTITKPSALFEKHEKRFSKTRSATEFGTSFPLDSTGSTSPSFQIFHLTLTQLASRLLAG